MSDPPTTRTVPLFGFCSSHPFPRPMLFQLVHGPAAVSWILPQPQWISTTQVELPTTSPSCTSLNRLQLLRCRLHQLEELVR